MSEYADVEAALVKAHEAGDTANAQVLADFLRDKRGPVPTAEPENDANWIQRNMELPLGMGGAMAGAAMGAPLGPVGMVAGGIIGGALGSGGGSLLSDTLEGKELDFADAVNEMGMSIGFDIVTLGAGKYVKAGYLAGKQALGYTAKEVADELAEVALKENAERIAKETAQRDGLDLGSNESLKASQELLEAGGASLSRFQTGQASVGEIWMEKLANIGMVSGGTMAENTAKANVATQQALNEVANKVAFGSGQGPADLGTALFDIITTGKKAMGKTYGEGIDAISASVAKKNVSVAPVKNALKKFLKDNSVVGKGPAGVKDSKILGPSGQPIVSNVSGKPVRVTELSDPAKAFVEKQLRELEGLATIPADGLLKLDKKLAQGIREFGEFGTPAYNTTASRQLGQMQEAIKKAFSDTLAEADPKAAEELRGLQKAYAEGMGGLLPELNKDYITKAGKADYDGLGKVLLNSGDTSKTVAMFKSIDEAYAQIGKGSTDALPFKTAAEAKQHIKQSYLAAMIGDNMDNAFDMASHANLAKRFANPANASKLKVIMGDDYGRTKQIFNMMAEASKKPDSSFGSLLLRGKEYGGILAAGALLTGGAAASGAVGTVVTGAAILAAPVILAKMATDPKAVNKLLAFSKRKFTNDQKRDTAALLLVSDFMDNLTTEERQVIKAELK
tara:strand:+ start:736 stop:2769 length:2034 start_codon:yes stop_codon:yes gene_type:complete